MIKTLIDRIKIEFKYPVDTTVRIKTDYPGVTRKVTGYEYYNGAGYLLFDTHGKINMERLEDLVEWSY